MFFPRGRALPLTDAEQRLTEIWEACYEGKAKKVQLSWTPQLRALHDQTAFSINKGVKTFDLCEKHSVLVTGGLDRLVRVWNPYFSGWEITINSSGLPRSPQNVRYFLFLFLFPGNQLVFWKATVLPSATSASPQRTVRSSPSPSTTLWKWFFLMIPFSFALEISPSYYRLRVSDMCQKLSFYLNYSNAPVVVHLAVFQVWDIQEQHCLLTVDSEESGIRGGITACSYSSAMKSLYVAADGMAVLSLKRRSVAAPLCSVHERTISPSLYISEENLFIDLFLFLRDHFHNSPAEQWFSWRFAQIAACLLLIFLLFWQASPSRSTHYLSRRARGLLRLLRGISSGCQLQRGICA